ncbi:endonuclease domain-containing protein [Pseudoclavibacter sp. 13-3]|uniref:endonuclease domain-containing protein n=1 Tax=Pseudoclavibacter sp. 13-3 TaxID=2901228 RepID=UPI001E5932CA|nr:DUF559 domain-containing protein [Pseudoclavibacter sp. 13-3]MCD7101451.1 endonuclease domain-containing protein [Pseudoclavibacter sp. 13-3]
MSPWELRGLVVEGALGRVRHGWYAEPAAEPLVLSAVQAGGVLSGLHRLKLIDEAIWLPPGAPRHLAALQTTHAHSWKSHRRPEVDAEQTRFGVVPPRTAVRHGLADQPLDQATAVVDSLLRCAGSVPAVGSRRGLSLTSTEIFAELARSPLGRRVLRYADAAAESGLESVTRVRLQQSGHRVETQVPIAHGQRIDIVVDGILAIEVDGGTHDGHHRTARDRAKEADIRAAGYRVVRFSYWQIMEQWPRVYAEILQLLR